MCLVSMPFAESLLFMVDRPCTAPTQGRRQKQWPEQELQPHDAVGIAAQRGTEVIGSHVPRFSDCRREYGRDRSKRGRGTCCLRSIIRNHQLRGKLLGLRPCAHVKGLDSTGTWAFRELHGSLDSRVSTFVPALIIKEFQYHSS